MVARRRRPARSESPIAAAPAGASAADGSATLVLALAGAVDLREPAGRPLPWLHAEPAATRLPQNALPGVTTGA